MIFYRGGGIIAIFLPALVAVGVFKLTGGNTELSVGATMISGVLVWFIGYYLNKTGPRNDLQKAMDARRAELHGLVEAGRYYREGYPMPTSLADAHRQADEQLAAEEQEHKSEMRNGHTLMFIPLQYWSFVIVAVSVVYYLRVKGIIGPVFGF